MTSPAVTRHWHVVEREGRIRLLRSKLRVVSALGADSASLAFQVLSRRASELMLDGWLLDVDQSSDNVVTVNREGHVTVVEVSDCWDSTCLAARPPRPISPDGDGPRDVGAGR